MIIISIGGVYSLKNVDHFRMRVYTEYLGEYNETCQKEYFIRFFKATLDEKIFKEIFNIEFFCEEGMERAYNMIVSALKGGDEYVDITREEEIGL
jgi:hypothetical protein